VNDHSVSLLKISKDRMTKIERTINPYKKLLMEGGISALGWIDIFDEI